MRSFKEILKIYTVGELVKKFDFKYGIGRLERMLTSNWINPWKTVWLNFRSFPLRQAWRMPVWVYGRPRFYCLSGSMRVEGKVLSGMIRFNKDMYASPSLNSAQSVICNYGQIIFRGKGLIGTGTKIVVGDGTLDCGANFKITDFCNIGCLVGITLGEQCRIAHRCQIFDSNYHYVANFNTRSVKRCGKPVRLGKGCWLCNSSTVSSGVILPDYTTVASHSLVNRDFSALQPSSLIGGAPAKFIANGFRKIENTKLVADIDQFFAQSTSDDYPMEDAVTMEQCSWVDIFR